MEFKVSSFWLFILSIFSISLVSQENRNNSIKAFNDEINIDSLESKNIDRFNRWAFSEDKHDAFFYLAPMYQYGTGFQDNAYNLHHDFGVMYRWFISIVR